MKTIITSLFLLLFTIEGFSQCLTCHDLVYYSMDENCEVVIRAQDLIEENNCPGNYLVAIRDQYGNMLSNPIQGYHGMTLSVTVLNWTTGSTCFTTVILEDKLPPVINAVVTPVGATCGDDLESLVVVDASDNCGSVTTTLTSSFIITDNNCGLASVYFIYEVSDNAGNTTSVNAQFEIIDFCPDVSAPAILFADCGEDLSQVGRPVFGPGSDESQFSIQAYDIIISDNHIQRKWIVGDPFCNYTVEFHQNIYISDNEKPTIGTTHAGPFTYEEYTSGLIEKSIFAFDNCGIDDVNIDIIDKSLIQCDKLTFEVSYRVTAVDLYGNQHTEVFDFVVKQNTPPAVDIVPQSRLCVNTGSMITTQVAGMEGPLTYNYSSSWPMKKNPKSPNALVYPNSSKATITVTVTDRFGCQVDRVETFYRCRFRENVEEEINEVTLTPTLVLDQAQLKLPFIQEDSWNVTIVDMMGKIVHTRRNITSNMIDLDLVSLPAGSYFMQVANQVEKHTEKFVKL